MKTIFVGTKDSFKTEAENIATEHNVRALEGSFGAKSRLVEVKRYYYPERKSKLFLYLIDVTDEDASSFILRGMLADYDGSDLEDRGIHILVDYEWHCIV